MHLPCLNALQRNVPSIWNDKLVKVLYIQSLWLNWKKNNQPTNIFPEKTAFILLSSVPVEDLYQPWDLEDQLDILSKVHVTH